MKYPRKFPAGNLLTFCTRGHLPVNSWVKFAGRVRDKWLAPTYPIVGHILSSSVSRGRPNHVVSRRRLHISVDHVLSSVICQRRPYPSVGHILASMKNWHQPDWAPHSSSGTSTECPCADLRGGANSSVPAPWAHVPKGPWAHGPKAHGPHGVFNQ